MEINDYGLWIKFNDNLIPVKDNLKIIDLPTDEELHTYYHIYYQGTKIVQIYVQEDKLVWEFFFYDNVFQTLSRTFYYNENLSNKLFRSTLKKAIKRYIGSAKEGASYSKSSYIKKIIILLEELCC